MPCFCYYDPPEPSKKKIKYLCDEVVKEIKKLEEDGDPIGLNIDDVCKLLRHIYSGKCDNIKSRTI
jgi:hypothetical protein